MTQQQPGATTLTPAVNPHGEKNAITQFDLAHQELETSGTIPRSFVRRLGGVRLWHQNVCARRQSKICLPEVLQ